MYCPNCVDVKMESFKFQDTEIQVCPDCPYVCFTHHNLDDVLNLAYFLNNRDVAKAVDETARKIRRQDMAKRGIVR